MPGTLLSPVFISYPFVTLFFVVPSFILSFFPSSQVLSLICWSWKHKRDLIVISGVILVLLLVIVGLLFYLIYLLSLKYSFLSTRFYLVCETTLLLFMGFTNMCLVCIWNEGLDTTSANTINVRSKCIRSSVRGTPSWVGPLPSLSPFSPCT